jgi:hypothetical protein
MTRRFMISFALASLGAGCATADGRTLDGEPTSRVSRWTGSLGPGELLLTLTKRGERLRADFPSIGQSGLEAVFSGGDKARVTTIIETPMGAFHLTGAMKGAAYHGKWQFAGLSGTFRLDEAAAPPPPYREENVTFIGAHGTKLSGVLILPLARGPHPGFCRGSWFRCRDPRGS